MGENDSLNLKMSHRAEAQSDAPRFSPRISDSEKYLLRGRATPFVLHEQVFWKLNLHKTNSMQNGIYKKNLTKPTHLTSICS